MKHVVEARLVSGDTLRFGVYPRHPERLWVELDEFDLDEPDEVHRQMLGDLSIEKLQMVLDDLWSLHHEYRGRLEGERQVEEALEREQEQRDAVPPALQLVVPDDES